MTNLKSSFFSISVLFVLTLIVVSILLVWPYLAGAQLSTNNATIPQKISVKITSPKANQTVPLGQLTIYGISSDTKATNCHVYVDWNDAKPMQNVTGIGPGGLNDYSNWTFTYTQKYHLIQEGINELTSKISCNDNSGISNITSKYYSINITGSTKSTNSSIPGTYDSHTPQTFHSIDSRSILPQYAHSDALNNDSKNVSKVKEPKSNVYIEISNGYSNDKKTNGDNKIINFKISSSLISSNVDKAQDGQKDFGVNHQDLNRYIHNLIREKLDRLSDQFVH